MYVPLDEAPATHAQSRVTASGMLGWLQARLCTSFLRQRPQASKTLRPTAWLDGLRGIAALFVVLHHSSLVWFAWDVHAGWTGAVAGNSRWLIQLPFVRLLIAGPPQVLLFFAVSGYALAHKPLQLARQRRFADARAALASAMFRRHARLYLPAAAVSLAAALATYLGWYQAFELAPVAQGRRAPPRADSLRGQLVHYARLEMAYMNPFTKGQYNPYDDNLWTLPFEFQCAMAVFVWLAAFTRVPGKVRLLATMAMAWYVEFVLADWSLFLFFGGVLVCDVDLALAERPSSPRGPANAPTSLPVTAGEGAHRTHSPSSAPRWQTDAQQVLADMVPRRAGATLRKAAGLAVFVAALYVLGMPSDFEGRAASVGYVRVAAWLPGRTADDVAMPIAALALVFTVGQCGFLQALFTNRFAQHMGRISFALYLVHGPLLWTWGTFLANTFVPVFGHETDLQYGMAIAVTAALWWTAALYLADLVDRFVDAKCVAFMKWVYESLETQGSAI